MNIQQFSPKDPSEVISLTFEFAALVSDVASAVWSISVHRGADPDPSSMLYGGVYTSATNTQHLIQGGLPENVYLIRAAITSTAGEVYVGYAYLPVTTPLHSRVFGETQTISLLAGTGTVT